MVDTLISSVAIVAVFGMLFYLTNNRVKDWLELRRNKQSVDEEQQRVGLMERKNKAELDKATANERAEKERAQLLQESAEARVAAQVADDSEVVAARTQEEKRIIEARTEGRAQAARERAASETADSSLMSALIDGYKAYLDSGALRISFYNWLGDLDLDDFR